MGLATSRRTLRRLPASSTGRRPLVLRWQAFNQKKPYFISTVFSLVLVAFAVGFLFEKLAQSKEAEINDLEPKVQANQAKHDAFKKVYSKLQAAQSEAGQFTTWMEQRYYWGDVLVQLRGVLIRSEENVRKKLSVQKPNVEVGIWIEQMATLADMQGAGMSAYNAPMPGINPEGGRYNPATTSPDPAAAADQAKPINLTCRAVDLSGIDPSANSEIAYTVEKELQACPIFDPKTTQLTGQITPDGTSGTFTFGVTVMLQNPLKL